MSTLVVFARWSEHGCKCGPFGLLLFLFGSRIVQCRFWYQLVFEVFNLVIDLVVWSAKQVGYVVYGDCGLLIYHAFLDVGFLYCSVLI